jgi:hypothetical protein
MIHRLGRVPDWYRVGFDRVWFAPDPGEASLLERHLPSEGKVTRSNRVGRATPFPDHVA